MSRPVVKPTKFNNPWYELVRCPHHGPGETFEKPRWEVWAYLPLRSFSNSTSEFVDTLVFTSHSKRACVDKIHELLDKG